jgi:hypothetical protein
MNRSSVFVAPREAHVALAAFLLVQALDGALTITGIRRYGDTVEANVFVWTLVRAWGDIHGVAAAKAFAAACGLMLYLAGSYRLLAVAAGAHIALAIIPWLITLAG